MPSGFITFFLLINHWMIIDVHICLWPEFKGPACIIYSSMLSLSLNGIEKYIFSFLGDFLPVTLMLLRLSLLVVMPPDTCWRYRRTLASANPSHCPPAYSCSLYLHFDSRHWSCNSQGARQLFWLCRWCHWFKFWLLHIFLCKSLHGQCCCCTFDWSSMSCGFIHTKLDVAWPSTASSSCAAILSASG